MQMMIDHYKKMTPSQKKLLKDQEQWMMDSGIEYDGERSRTDAIYDIKQRFPTEEKAKLALEMYAGDPTVLQIYRLGLARKRNKNNKIIKSKRKCKCK